MVKFKVKAESVRGRAGNVEMLVLDGKGHFARWKSMRSAGEDALLY